MGTGPFELPWREGGPPPSRDSHGGGSNGPSGPWNLARDENGFSHGPSIAPATGEYLRHIFAYIVPIPRVYMSLMQRQGWHCQFLGEISKPGWGQVHVPVVNGGLEPRRPVGNIECLMQLSNVFSTPSSSPHFFDQVLDHALSLEESEARERVVLSL